MSAPIVNIAVVGCGGMAHWHVETLLKIPESRLVAFVDVDPKKTAEFKTRYSKEAKEYSSFDTLLESPPKDLHAVVLVTPHTLHFPQATAALNRGFHVLCEKPMVTNSQHAYQLWETANKIGKLLAISFQAPYTKEYQAIKRARAAGILGKPQLISGWLAQGWLKGTIGTWRQDPSLSGGGQMYDSGAHVLNALMWIMDEPVVEVACMYDTCGSPVDINGVAMLRFASGAMGTVTLGGNSPGWDVEVRVQTDKLQYRTGPHGHWLNATADGKPFEIAIPEHNAPAAFTPHGNFVRAICGWEELHVPPRYGVLLSALMDAMYESAAKRTPVIVKPVPDRL
jgi:predicted dehydrogenase